MPRSNMTRPDNNNGLPTTTDQITTPIFAEAVAVDSSGNVYVTGESAGPGTYMDYATIKYNFSGQQQWVIRYDGPGHDLDRASGIAVNDSGNVYVTGWSWGAATSSDYATVKYNSAG